MDLKRSTLCIFIAFLLTVAIRSPHLGRPLSKHHEFCTGTALIAMQGWEEGGIRNYHFAPSVTFSGEANRHIGTLTYDFMQRDGIQYYLSHSPFAFYLPYATFSVLNIAVSVLALQWFNMIFHLFTALMLMLVVRELVVDTTSLAPLFSALFYLFMPATLWYHGNVYMSDMFVQNVWVINLLITLRMFIREKLRSAKYLVMFAVSLMLTIYTEWMGVFVGVAVGMLAVHRWYKTKEDQYLPVLFISIASVITVLAFVIWQYSSIAGWDTLREYYSMRYGERGSMEFGDGHDLLHHLLQLMLNYITSFLPLLLCMGVISGLMFFDRERLRSLLPNNFGLFAWLTVVPVVIDHVVFLKYAYQEFAVLKAAFFLCTWAAFLVISKLSRSKAWASTIVICSLGTAVYFVVNRPGPVSWKGDVYAVEMNIGHAIRENAMPDEVVFSSGMVITTPITFYAHRNIEEVSDKQDVASRLKALDQTRGILFFEHQGELQHERFEIP